MSAIDSNHVQQIQVGITENEKITKALLTINRSTFHCCIFQQSNGMDSKECIVFRLALNSL